MKPNYSDEQELVSNVKNNDVSAFDILYWRYHEAVYLNIRKLIKDSEAAKDIMQDVFVALWTRKESLNPDKSIGGWLFVTSYHKCIDYLKQTVPRPLVERDAKWIDEIVDLTKENDRIMHFNLIEEAVSQLSPQKKKVFELCKLKGKTYEETAMELNISKHTVKEYLAAAIAYIRNYAQIRIEQTLVTTFLLFLAF